jgi:uncharacterized protein involved in exopolysaccharide biosynthesis
MAEPTTIKQETTLRDFLNVIFRRKWVIIAVIALTTLLVFYLNARQPVIFESNSRTLIRRGEQSNILTGSIRYLGWAEEVSSQIEVILSEEVFGRAKEIYQDSLKAKNLPAGLIFAPGAIRADVMGESNVFIIRYTGFDPVVCKLGCQAMTLSFQEYYRKRKAPPALVDFFAGEIADVGSDLEHWKGKRNEFMSKENFFGIEEESRFLMNKIGNLEANLLESNNDVAMQTLKVESIANLMNINPADLENELAFSFSGRFVQAGIVQSIKHSIQNLNIKREELLQKYTPKHPEIIAIENQLAGLRADLKKEIENSWQIEKQTLQSMVAKHKSITDELNRANTALESLPKKQMSLGRIDRKIADLEEKNDLLLNKQSESEIALAGNPEWEVTILSNASNAFTKKTKDYVRLALGPFLSLIVGLGLAFFLESLDHSVKNMAEAEEYLSASVLATISDIRK